MASKNPDRPNIVFFLTDDQGPWAMHCAGNQELITPNLDRLADTGMRFTDCFCVSPVCSPARASILTGTIPSRHGIHDWLRGGNAEEGGIEFLEGIPALTDHLARAGYRCGISGKWHLGDSVHPQKSFSDWYVHRQGGGPYYNAPMYRDGQAILVPEYITDNITDRAIDFLDSYAQDDRPFYLSVHYTAPHSPWDPANHPDEYLDLYADCPFQSTPDLPPHPWIRQQSPGPKPGGLSREKLLQGYFAAITAMDANVGRVLDRLESHGLRENTLVVFTSDNGMHMGHHGIWGKGNGTFPLNMFEEAIKVPALMSRPGHLPEGKVCQPMVSHYDFMPTLLDYLDIEHPDADKLPGSSFAPLLRDQEAPERQEVCICEEYGPVRMIRTRQWKYVHRYPYGPNELYDLANDPGEAENLAEDPDQAERRNALRARLDAWFLQYANPERDGAHQACYGRGQIDRVGPEGQGRTAFVEQLE